MDCNNQELKFESDDDLVNVDLNDLIPGITASQHEILTSSTSLNADLLDLPTSNAFLEPQPAGLYTHSAGLNLMIPATAVVTSSTPVTESITTPVSLLRSYPGPYQFCVQFSQAQDSTKATPWIFSEKLNKLYAAMDKAVPVHFNLERVSSVLDYCHFWVRALVVFSQAQDFNTPVKPCDVHRVERVQAAESSVSLNHFLLCDDPGAQYCEHENGQYSVAIRLSQPPVGERHVTTLFRFMCRSSCMGGVNRRPTSIVFTLETQQGDVMGRYCVPVRVCCCPGRDMRNEEEKAKEKNSPQQVPDPSEPGNSGEGTRRTKRKRKMDILVVPEIPQLELTVAPSILAAQDDDEVYQLEVRGRRRYEILRSLRDSFDLMDAHKQKQ